MYKVQTLNNIAPKGLNLLTKHHYQVASEIADPDAILLRSYKMHDMALPDSLIAVARAGAGVNNIPIDKLSALGVPVFNTPGANANAVKELVLAGMLLACRNICQSWDYVRTLETDDEALSRQVEQAKKQFVGFELPGRTLAVVGLGAIGVKIANAALSLGMQVIGFDPGITIQRAWELSANVKQAKSLEAALAAADFVTLHVPFGERTKNLINAETLARLKPEAILLNFARGGIVDEAALLNALEQNTLARYVCDFPSNQLKAHPHVIALPHLGASTKEAEENCAVMAAEQLCDYLENGHIQNSVNFPSTSMTRNGAFRITVANANIPNMVGQISTALAEANLNIVDMINKSHGDVAYTLVDVNAKIPEQTIKNIASIEGVLKVRVL